VSRRDQSADPAIVSRDNKIAELEGTVEKFRDGINALIDTHAPRMGKDAREHIHPGWDRDGIDFYCERCRTAWPCQTINDLRALVGEAIDWDRAKVPYAPLRLHLVPEVKAEDADD
jgi:hypothetical protein